MPYLQLNTSVKMSDAQKHELCCEIGKLMPLIPGKTRDNTMMAIFDGCFMEKGDNGLPALNLVVRVLGGVSDDDKNTFIASVSGLFEDKLSVRQDFMYINIVALDDWGSGGALKKPGK